MLNEIAYNIYQDNLDKGFWGDKQCVEEFGAERSRNFGEVLMLIVTEVAEAMEEWRDGSPIADQITEHPSGDRCLNGTCEVAGKPVGVPSELADIIIRVLDACGAYGIDIDGALEAKINYNRTRARLHGRVR